ncbi:MAG TPA: sigma-70 family RNA polymerase sigma factor [Acidimicrobiales bacterium]|nr:sigma-70 family RNA polymerase sigma factor [Acidimicrobiales bacterium]
MSWRQRSDADLAFEDLVREMSSPMIRAATFLTKDATGAKDLAQEALLRTYSHWSRAHVNPKAYVWTTLINLCRDERRRQIRRPHTQTNVPETQTVPDRVLMAERVVERLELERVLQLLPQQQREVVGLRYLVGLSVAEVADVLLIPEGTVNSAASRAITTMRETLEELSKEEEINVD